MYQRTQLCSPVSGRRTLPKLPHQNGRPWSLIGPRLFELHRDLLAFLGRMAREQGDVAHVTLGPSRMFLLSHPEHIKDILVTDSRRFVKGRGTRRAKLLLGEGLLTSEGAFHQRQRRMQQPAFHRHRIAGYGRCMVECAARAVSSWRDGEVVDVCDAMARLTLDIAGRALFGVDLGPEAAEVSQALTDVLGYFGLAVLPGSELLDRMPFIPVVRRFRRGRARLDETIARVIAGVRSDPRAAERDDLAAVLVAAHDAAAREGAPDTSGWRPGDRQLRDELMTLLIAGYETVSDSMAWAWYLLSRHPEVERRLHEELDEVLEGRPPASEDLPRLPYTRAVVSEQLRLYPAAYLAGYTPLEPHPLEGGFIPKGSLVLMCQYLVHRDARWWPRPESFEPERWLSEAPADRPRYAYFPFGGGQRACVAEHFATLEAVLVIATIAQRWRLRLESAGPVEIDATLTLRPRGGLKMRAQARELRSTRREIA